MLNKYVSQLRRNILATKRKLSSKSVSSIPRTRFWTHIVSVQHEEGVDLFHSLERSSSECSDIILGMAFLPNGRAAPIHKGRVQMQHCFNVPFAPDLHTENTDILLCALNNRAETINQDFIDDSNNNKECTMSNEERPFDPLRLEALKSRLLTLGIDAVSCFGVDGILQSTAPSRIYHSFVRPRERSKLLKDTLERNVDRVAHQIAMAIRQVNADRAMNLRNTDSSSSDDGSREQSVSSSSSPVITHNKHHSKDIVIVCDNLRSAFNVGSIFRTAETAGVQKIITTGITPHPPHPKLRKTAMQSIDIVPTTHIVDVIEAIKQLKSQDYHIIVMETTNSSECYTDITYPHKTALICGNEITGVDTRILDMADKIVEIPTYGIKNSLNVSSALPVVVYEIVRQGVARPMFVEAAAG
jgi:23S rRNA (guanosine2251-2'-O)-methyltransferase